MSYSAKMLVLVQLPTCIGTESVRMTECGADFLHLDVMDGHSVQNIMFSHPMVECLRNCVWPDPFCVCVCVCFLPDMHLMVSGPEQWVKPMAGANQYTFHLEATTNATLPPQIRESGMKVGLAIKPGTTVEELAPWAGQINMALKFMEDMMPKVSWLRSQFPSLDIVDGGVGPSAIHKCAEVSNMPPWALVSDDPRSVQICRSAPEQAVNPLFLGRH
uniref:ribulose-phosphate 3-epimerase n=1 Tax=Oncorhynchus kisutch TaxID=8019 RepID=A0A8C7FTD8_ONCKI